MKRLVLLACAIFFFATQASAAEALRNVSFSQKIESKKDGALFEAKTWMKDGKVRMEYVSMGENVISIIKDKKVYNFSPKTKMGTVVSVSALGQEQDQVGPEIIQSKDKFYEFLKNMKAKKTGEESVDGKLCVVYEYITDKTKVLNRVWMWKDQDFPVKSTIEVNGDVITVVYKDIQIGGNIESNIFDIPADVKVQDLAAITKKKVETEIAQAEKAAAQKPVAPKVEQKK